jgi:hypothetical protein
MVFLLSEFCCDYMGKTKRNLWIIQDKRMLDDADRKSINEGAGIADRRDHFPREAFSSCYSLFGAMVAPSATMKWKPPYLGTFGR